MDTTCLEKSTEILKELMYIAARIFSFFLTFRKSGAIPNKTGKTAKVSVGEYE